ncbi:MAG: ABC transporter substrate-binding protein [Acidimicrobiia bacterium]|nr:ABC transporter substrate-binding protein [Acidimicrobiia bacterium]MDH5236060.1 ABC transporter substrate-binding protein [Acidimicrobiia bacterium]
MIADLEQVTAPGYLADLAKRSIDDVRSMRSDCQGLENGLSYVRRLAQGRIDIVGGELARRRGGSRSDSVADLLSRLPEDLSEGYGASSSTVARPPQSMDHTDSADELEDLLNQILPASALGGLADRDDRSLRGLLDRLQEFEHSVSESRRTLHGLIDHLQAEITRRYTTGEASVDSLLS